MDNEAVKAVRESLGEVADDLAKIARMLEEGKAAPDIRHAIKSSFDCVNGLINKIERENSEPEHEPLVNVFQAVANLSEFAMRRLVEEKDPKWEDVKDEITMLSIRIESTLAGSVLFL